MFETFLRQNTSKITTKSSDVAYLPPLWRHASLLNDGSCSFTHPVVKDRMCEERRQARKMGWPVNAGRVICCYQNNLCEIINHHKHIRYWFFGCISCGFKHNHNKPYRHWRQDGGWDALSIVTHATAWRRELSLYTSHRQGQPLQFRAKNPRSHVIMLCYCASVLYLRKLHMYPLLADITR